MSEPNLALAYTTMPTIKASEYKSGKDTSRLEIPSNGFAITKEIINTLPFEMVFVNRDGSTFIVPPIPNARMFRGIIIRQTIKEHNKTSFDTTNSIERGLSDELDAILNARDESSPGVRGMMDTGYTFEYRFSQEDLFNVGDTVYLKELDMVLSSLTTNPPTHPYSLGGGMPSGLDTNMGGAAIYIAVIDNEGIFGKRFINLAGQVHVIKPVRNISMPSGVYVKRFSVLDENQQEQRESLVRFEFSECNPKEKGCKLDLFSNPDDARYLGSRESIEEQLRKEKEVKMADWKRELEQEKLIQEAAAKQRNMEQDLERKEREYEMAQDNLRTKYEYEDRSYRRKETSELFKWLPTVITAGLSLYTLIKAT